MQDISENAWYAIKVKYKSEKIVLQQLDKKGVISYAPMRNYTKRYKRKIVHHTVPILPCYLFVQIPAQDYIKVLETEYVYNFVKTGPQLRPVQDREIEILRRIEGIEEDLILTEVEYGLGQSVKVSNGPLFGMKGIISQIKSKGKLVVNFDSLGIALQIEINKKQLEPSTV
ncbi:MAG: UpxY family transcription antiterminator [Saprospiraceae bacterium]|nr:UpxY family transcription antiterminator [Candidatus Brachybacter algidus]